MNHAQRTSRLARRRTGAFTLFELLVVIIIILALVIVTVPAFSRLLESANFANTVNAVTGTLGNARALAISRGQPAGVVFLYDTRTGEYTLQVVELVRGGTRADLTNPRDRGENSLSTKAWGLRPAQNTTPVTLPKGSGVYGLSFNHVPPRGNNPEQAILGGNPAYDRISPNADTQQWYAGELFRHPQRAQWIVNPWIFPRNDPRLYLNTASITDERKRREGLTLQDVWDLAAGETVAGVNITQAVARQAIRHANSFVVMFSPGGVVVPMHDGGGATIEFNFYLEFPDGPVDSAPTGTETPAPYDNPFAFDPEFIPTTIGRPSPNPEALLRAVDMLAVVNFNALVAGARVDQPWELHPSSSRAPWPPFRGTAEYANTPIPPNNAVLDELVVRVSDWIDANAEIISFDRYSGAAQRRRDSQ